jgi:hypothetical protein
VSGLPGHDGALFPPTVASGSTSGRTQGDTPLTPVHRAAVRRRYRADPEPHGGGQNPPYTGTFRSVVCLGAIDRG